MIVGEAFPGDDHDLLKKIQHDMYWEPIGLLVDQVERIYLLAARLMGVQNEFLMLVEEPRTFDHRVVQHFHDQIAAYYRYMLVGGNQITLPL